MARETTAAKILAFPGEDTAEVRQDHGLTSPSTGRVEMETAAAGPERDRRVNRPNEGLTNEDLRELHRDHFAGLLSYFMKRGFSRAESEDLVSETFVAAVGSRSSFRGEAKASTWLYGIASKVAGKRLRALGTQKRAADLVRVETWDDIRADAGEEASQGNNPFLTVSTREQRALLRSAVEALAFPYRECLQLRLFGGRSYKAIAQTLDLKIGQVSTYLHEAKKKLRQTLKRRGALR